MGKRAAVLVVLGLLSVSCSAAGAPDAATDSATTDSVSPATAPVVSSVETTVVPPKAVSIGAEESELYGLLRTAGAEVFDDDAPPSTTTATAFSVGQIASMNAELERGGGMSGSDLAAIVGADLLGVSAAQLVGAWVETGDSDLATWAREWAGGQDWTHPESTVIPAAVLAAFVTDVVAIASTGATSSADGSVPQGMVEPRPLRNPAAVPAAAPAQVPGECGGALGWIESVIQFLLVAIDVAEPTWAKQWFEQAWAWQGSPSQQIEIQYPGWREAMSVALAQIWVITQAVTSLPPLGFTVTSDPPADRFAVGQELDRPQVFTAHVTGDAPADLPWPVNVCAEALGVKLPFGQGWNGTPVEWTLTGLPQLGAETGRDDKIVDGSASFRWVTGREETTDGDEVVEQVSAHVQFDPTGFEQLMFVFDAALAMAAGMTNTIQFVVSHQTGVGSQIATMVDLTVRDALQVAMFTFAVGSSSVTHHKCAAPGGVIPDGVWSGPLVMNLQADIQVATGGTTDVGSGSVTLEVEGGVVTGGSWTLDWTAEGYAISEGGAAGYADGIVGHLDGGAAGSASKPTFSGTATISGNIQIASPIEMSIPLDGTAPAYGTMVMTDLGCTVVTGTLVPSLNETANGVVAFDGELTWTGTLVP